MRPWHPFEIRYGSESGRSLTSLRQSLLSEGPSWVFNLMFLKAKAAENLHKSMTEFDQMSKPDKAIEMALIAARGWMRAWEAKMAESRRA